MIQVAVQETWKPIPGFKRAYEVSDQGRVRSLDRVVRHKNGRKFRLRGRVLSPLVRGHSQSYLYVALWRKRRRTTMYVHRAVLLAFVGPPPERDSQASHEPDPDPSNCRLENLQWRTPEFNHAEMDMRRWKPIDVLLGNVLPEYNPPDDDCPF